MISITQQHVSQPLNNSYSINNYNFCEHLWLASARLASSSLRRSHAISRLYTYLAAQPTEVGTSVVASTVSAY